MVELVFFEVQNVQTPSEAFFLTMKERHGDRMLTMMIGLSEARAIVLEKNKLQPKRPSTHDLFSQLVQSIRLTPEDVEIHKYEDGIFFANINFHRENGESVVLDSRTSDAVVLALKWGIPMYIDENAFEKYLSENILNDLSKDEKSEKFTSSDWKDDIRNDEYIIAKLQEMTDEELEELLQGAVECEDFEMASKIHEEMEKRKNL